MTDLNTFKTAEVLIEDSFDALTVTDMGDGILALSQVADDGTLHNIIIGEEQAAALLPFLQKAIQ